MTFALASTNEMETGNPATGQTKLETVGESFTNVVDSFETTVAGPVVPVLRDIRDTVAVDYNSGIESFLGRPIKLIQSSFALTDTGMLSHFPGMFTQVANSMVASKVAGRYLLRATLCVKLQVNANKFQQGRYILGACPLGGVSKLDSTCRDSYFAMHTYSKVQITQLPHVELDISKDTEVTLKIPYVSYTNGFALQGAANGLGESCEVFLYTYSPLNGVTGSTTASYTLFGWFEDIELEGICVPQMGLGEQKSQKIGPIESTLTKVSKSTGILSRIPLISSFTKPVSWVSSVFADAAHVWGWSRPKNLSPETRVITNPYMSLTTVDNPVVVAPLSLGCNNEIQPVDGFAGSKHDELAIDWIKNRFAWTNSITWSTTDVADTSLQLWYVAPNQHYVDTADGLVNLRSLTPICALSNMFKYYRGGQLVRLKFVKTDFHSGRLMVVFGPATPTNGVPLSGVTATQSQYVHRQVIDIRETNEIVIAVPFVSVVPWLPCSHATGDLKIFVLDPLKAPATVTQSVQILVEWAADDDFELSIPNERDGVTPVIPLTPQMGEYAPKASIGGSSNLTSTILQHSTCIGEKIATLRALIKRVTPWYTDTPLATGYNGIYHRALWCGRSGAITYAPAQASNWLVWVKSWYALERGSYRLINRVNDFNPYVCFLSTAYKNATQIIGPFVEEVDGVSHLVDTSKHASCSQEWLNSGPEKPVIEIPFYSPTVSLPVALDIVASSLGAGGIGPDPANLQIPFAHPVLECSQATAEPPLLDLKMGAGDDFDLGCFVSIPPIFESMII